MKIKYYHKIVWVTLGLCSSPALSSQVAQTTDYVFDIDIKKISVRQKAPWGYLKSAIWPAGIGGRGYYTFDVNPPAGCRFKATGFKETNLTFQVTHRDDWNEGEKLQTTPGAIVSVNNGNLHLRAQGGQSTTQTVWYQFWQLSFEGSLPDTNIKLVCQGEPQPNYAYNVTPGLGGSVEGYAGDNGNNAWRTLDDQGGDVLLALRRTPQNESYVQLQPATITQLGKKVQIGTAFVRPPTSRAEIKLERMEGPDTIRTFVDDGEEFQLGKTIRVYDFQGEVKLWAQVDAAAPGRRTNTLRYSVTFV
ncbi:hypothetical protein NA727_23365 [Escherichia coli]|nr:hypothetical protein [Escherichia coli]